MTIIRNQSSKSDQFIQSFEVTNGGKSGDLISEKVKLGKLKVGLLATGFFEFFRMYEGLEEQTEANMQKIADNISPFCDLVYPGMIQTIDQSDAAGRLFKQEGVDAVIIAEGTYSVDYLIHQALLHLPDELPLLLFASQEHSKLDYTDGYRGACRNSGPLGVVQFACSLEKMKKHLPYEVVVGAIDDPDVIADIERYIRVRTAIRNLRFMNIGLIGHIFRGMYDFQYDKTDILGKLGPHVMDIDIRHLHVILEELTYDDERVQALLQKAKRDYEVTDGITDDDILRAAHLGVALSLLVERYKLDGLALLGQHHIEAECRTTSYLGLAEIITNNQAVAVTEGDVLGLIISKVMKDLTGMTPFFGEWEEVDTSLNAVMFLGHGFIDPKVTRKDRKVKLCCACEEWGWDGKAPGLLGTFAPGPVTAAHIIAHAGEWQMLITEGTIPDTPPLDISECTVLMQVEEPVREYFKHVIENGFAHHAIVLPVHLGKELELFAKQIGVKVIHP